MKTFHASGLLSVMNVMGLWSSGGSELVPEISKTNNIVPLGSYNATFTDIGFSASKVTLEKIVKILEQTDCKWSDVEPLAKELIGRLVDETSDKVFFALTLRESEYFNKSRRGWEASVSRFPNTVRDVEEANKCFALSRYAAAVFHSLQVVEIGLIELGAFLKVKDPLPGWTSVSKALSATMKQEHKKRTRFEKRNFEFLEQVQGTIEGLKNAWRNKISHAHGKLTLMTADFSPEIAEEILFASRAFMRRLAEGLPAPKKDKSTDVLA